MEKWAEGRTCPQILVFFFLSFFLLTSKGHINDLRVDSSGWAKTKMHSIPGPCCVIESDCCAVLSSFPFAADSFFPLRENEWATCLEFLCCVFCLSCWAPACRAGGFGCVDWAPDVGPGGGGLCCCCKSLGMGNTRFWFADPALKECKWSNRDGRTDNLVHFSLDPA